MIFQYTWEWVVGISHHTGRPKTATRRLEKPTYQMRYAGDTPVAVVNCPLWDMWGRVVYTVGQRQIVMPARGVKGVRKVAEFTIARLWHQDVRDITDAQARDEGFASAGHFCQHWSLMHDVHSAPGGDDLMPFLAERPAAKYQAVVIEWLPESVVRFADAIQAAEGILGTRVLAAASDGAS